MKKVILVSAIISASGAQAYDYREDLSPGYSPNVETVEADRKLRDAKKPFPEYSDEERLQLICTIDGIPNEQIVFNIRPTNWERSYTEDGWTRENKIEVTADERHYVNTSYSSGIKGSFSMVWSTNKRVDRVTGAYTERNFQGSGFEYIQAVMNYDTHPKWKTKTGTCVPGAHKTEQMF